jgi:hypothetical protein
MRLKIAVSVVRFRPWAPSFAVFGGFAWWCGGELAERLGYRAGSPKSRVVAPLTGLCHLRRRSPPATPPSPMRSISEGSRMSTSAKLASFWSPEGRSKDQQHRRTPHASLHGEHRTLTAIRRSGLERRAATASAAVRELLPTPPLAAVSAIVRMWCLLIARPCVAPAAQSPVHPAARTGGTFPAWLTASKPDVNGGDKLCQMAA